MRVGFLYCIRLVIEDVEVSVADLEKIDVSGDDLGVKWQGKTTASIVRKVLTRQVYGYFRGGGYRIVDQHEAL
jgi:hypothetical protein